MTTRTAPMDWRRGIRVVGAHGAAKTNCTRVASSIDLVGGFDATDELDRGAPTDPKYAVSKANG